MTAYPGRVVQIDPAGPLVQVPLLAQHVPFGPLPTSVPDLVVGERVIVTSLGNTRDQLHVLGRVSGRPPTMDEIPGLEERFEQAEGRLDQLEGWRTEDRGLINQYGTRITSLEGRATSIEGVNTTQNQRLDALESGSSSGSAAITQLRADTAGRVTTKGDLLVGTGPGVLTRQPVPANGLALVGDSTQATGWAARDVLGMPKALTGATAPTRYVGATVTGAPTTGTFAPGDYVVAQNGEVWVCTAAGTPGTWAAAGAAATASLRTQLFGGSTRTQEPYCRIMMSAGWSYSPGLGDVYAQGGWADVQESEPMRTVVGAYTAITIPIAGRYRFRFHLQGVAGGTAGMAALKITTSTALPPSAALASAATWIPAGAEIAFDCVGESFLAAGTQLYWLNWGNINYTVHASAYGNVRTEMIAQYIRAA